MSNGYTRSPKLLKGALIELTEKFLIPIPNIIIFQYNPESLSRTMQPYKQPERESASGESGGESSETPDTAQPFDPEETFSLALELDATDALEQPELHPVAMISGVADRIAAMEMLLYPIRGSSDALQTSEAASLAGEGDGEEQIERSYVPIVLFVWGPGRIVPVRLESFSVEEQHFSPLLYPTHAKVTIGLKVLTPGSLPTEDSTAKDIAVAAYTFTRGQKEALAMANIANAVESILGLLPF